MRIEPFLLGVTRFEYRYPEGDETLTATTFYARCPRDCRGCTAPYYSEQQIEAALIAKEFGLETETGIMWFDRAAKLENLQNQVMTECPHNIAYLFG